MACVSFFFFKQKTAYELRISDWSSGRVLFRSCARRRREPVPRWAARSCCHPTCEASTSRPVGKSTEHSESIYGWGSGRLSDGGEKTGADAVWIWKEPFPVSSPGLDPGSRQTTEKAGPRIKSAVTKNIKSQYAKRARPGRPEERRVGARRVSTCGY